MMKGTTTESIIISELKASKHLRNQHFEEDLYLNLEKVDLSNFANPNQEIGFDECIFGENLVFQNLTCNNCSKIYFQNCHFKGETHFSNFDVSNLEFINCTFHKNSFFKILKSSSFKVESCTFLAVADFIDIENQRSYFSENFFQFCFFTNANVMFLNIVNYQKDITELNFKFNPKLLNVNIIDNQKIHKIVIGSLVNAKLSGNFNEIEIESFDLKSIEISAAPASLDKKCILKSLRYTDCDFEGKINIINYDIDSVYFRNITSPNGSLTLNNVSINKTFFSGIIIEKIYLNIVAFKNELTIRNCDFSGLRPNNVKWLKNNILTPDLTNVKISFLDKFRKNKKGFGKDENDIVNLKYQRDVFRQLKIASINNHNQIEALSFYKNEMRLYWKEIRLVGGDKGYDTFLIFVNRWVSDFGQNYWLPLFWMFIIHFVLFMSIFEWDFTWCLDFFKDGLGEYFKLLNPVRQTPEYINTGMGIFTDFWMRVLNGFFIYHFIKASRKFGKGE